MWSGGVIGKRMMLPFNETCFFCSMFNAGLFGLFRLMRVELSFAAGICVLLAEVLARGGPPSALQALCGFLAAFFIAASVLVLNDCFDIETDRMNSPLRPLPAELVTCEVAVAFSAVLVLFGLFSAFLLGWQAFIVVAVLLLFGILYNWRIKRYGLAGNLMVAVTVGMTFIFGGVAVGNLSEPMVWFMAVMTLGVDLGEEIAADALDVEGDRRTGSHSLAVMFGSDRAMHVAAGVFGFVLSLGVIPFAFGWFDRVYLLPIVLFDVVVFHSVSRMLNPRIPDRITDIRRIYIAGTAMILVVTLMRLTIG